VNIICLGLISGQVTLFTFTIQCSIMLSRSSIALNRTQPCTAALCCHQLELSSSSSPQEPSYVPGSNMLLHQPCEGGSLALQVALAGGYGQGGQWQGCRFSLRNHMSERFHIYGANAFVWTPELVAALIGWCAFFRVWQDRPRNH
jgi:hypothetical protein